MNLAVSYPVATSAGRADDVAVSYDVMTEQPLDTRVAVAYETGMGCCGMGDAATTATPTWAIAAAGLAGLAGALWFFGCWPFGRR